MSDLAGTYGAQLRHIFYEQTPAHQFAELLHADEEPSRAQDLGHLLRYHAGGIRDPWEIDMRDAADFYVAYGALLELAVLVGFLPEEEALSARTSVGRDLDRPELRRYYNKHYPLVLPELFRRRADGKPALPAGAYAEGGGSFQRFIRITEPIRNDPNVQMFLWFLDDGFQGPHGLPQLIDVFEDPDALFQRLARSPDDPHYDALDQALDGFRDFLIVCVEMDEMLRGLEGSPGAQSAYWHYYAYWFDHMGTALRDVIAGVVNRLVQWQGETEGGSQDRAEFDDDAARTIAAIESLTSGRYREPLASLVP